jgi:hypothetical protein
MDVIVTGDWKGPGSNSDIAAQNLLSLVHMKASAQRCRAW